MGHGSDRLSFLSLKDTLEDLPVEISKQELLVPFDVELCRVVSSSLRQAGWKPEGTPEAQETFRYLIEKERLKNEPVPSEFGLPDDLFMHQKLAVEFAAARQNAGLFLEMGLGKTRVALETLGAWSEKYGERNNALVIAPKTVISTWRAESIRWFGEDVVDYVYLMRGTGKQKREILDEFENDIALSSSRLLLVTNYATLLDKRLFARLLKVISSGDIETIVIDESTYIKSYSAQRSKQAWRLGQYARHRLILTGEPITQGPEDLFGQMRFLDDSVLGRKIVSFRGNYCVEKRMDFGSGPFNKVVGYKNLDALSNRVYQHCIQFSKRECLDLPPKIYQTHEIELTAPQLRAYKDMLTEFMAVLEGELISVKSVLSQIGKLTQITSGFMYRATAEGKTTVRFEDNPKLEVLRELVADLVPRHKIVVWANFREEVDSIVEALSKDAGEDAVTFVDGRVKDEAREESIRRLQEDTNCRIMVAQVATMSFGVNLHAADVAIYMSNTWSYEKRRQSEDRLHRIGMKSSSVLYIDLICPDTVDVTVTEALKNKSRLSERITKKQWERLAKGERYVDLG